MVREKVSNERRPGPVYMDDQQMSDYLRNLRSNRPVRPTGARPPPTNFRSVRQSLPVSSMVGVPEDEPEPETVKTPLIAPRARKASSHRKSASISNITSSVSSRIGSHIGRPMIRAPSAEHKPVDVAYQEISTRFMEKQESRSLRIALQQIDKAEEKQLLDAAQKEASELVYQHQNPSVLRAPHAPYKYPDQAASISTKSIAGPSGITVRKSRAGGAIGAGSRSASDGSDSAGTSSSVSSRVPSNGSSRSASSTGSVASRVRRRSSQLALLVLKKGEETLSGIRRSSIKKAFSSMELRGPELDSSDPTDEELEAKQVKITLASAKLTSNGGSVHTRNPFSRVRNARSSVFHHEMSESASDRKPYLDRVEIQRNPPSQSRNAEYTSTQAHFVNTQSTTTSDTNMKTKDGKEIRDDDLRKATSMSLRDRSPKLPTPILVSDAPGRPIVSFNNSSISKRDQSSDKPPVPSKSNMNSPASPTRPAVYTPSRAVKKTNAHSREPSDAQPSGDSRDSIPMISVSGTTDSRWPQPSVTMPTISVSDGTMAGRATKPIPNISVNAPATNVSPPTISVSAPPAIAISGPVSDMPTIAVSGPTIPISDSRNIEDTSSERPLPTPRSVKKQRPQWAVPAHSTLRSSILCNECAMPIAGRIVTAAGARFHPACFQCHHCSEALECVAFFPEPEHKRDERLTSEQSHPDFIEGTQDLSMRFYCHLDYHEFFSPRCKSCKTPIEGDVIVACGAEWHAGHFFCAQCGDPFEQSTPFVEKDGYAWCINCHTNRFSTKCRKCRKPVVDTVLQALGGEWHEECFCCHECGGKFDDGRYFLRDGEEDPVCPACEERRLKAS